MLKAERHTLVDFIFARRMKIEATCARSAAEVSKVVLRTVVVPVIRKRFMLLLAAELLKTAKQQLVENQRTITSKDRRLCRWQNRMGGEHKRTVYSASATPSISCMPSALQNTNI